MSKHRTQAEKLAALRERLKAGETIASREIRAAFGAEDYTAIYKKAREARKKERDDYDNQLTERTDAQKKAAQAIRAWLSITSRAAEGKVKSASADKWEERIGELFEEMDPNERAQMNYWTTDTETGAIIFNDDKTTEGLPIYMGYSSMGDLEGLKRRALADAIDETIGRDEDEAAVDATELKKRFDELKALKRR